MSQGVGAEKNGGGRKIIEEKGERGVEGGLLSGELGSGERDTKERKN